MAKISGPLLDRIDLHIDVPAVKYKELSSKQSGENSESIRARVIEAREVQARRFKGRSGLFANADMQAKEIREFCRLLKKAFAELNSSPRRLNKKSFIIRYWMFDIRYSACNEY